MIKSPLKEFLAELQRIEQSIKFTVMDISKYQSTLNRIEWRLQEIEKKLNNHRTVERK